MYFTDLLSARLRVAGLMLALGCASACSPATEAQSAQPATPAEASPAASTPASADFDPLPPDLAACAPPAAATPWTETGRTRGADGAEYVLIEPAGTAVSTEFDMAVLRVADDGCAGDRVEQRFAYPMSERFEALEDYDTWNALRDQGFAWHLGKVGSAEALADLYRARMGPALSDCPHHPEPGAVCIPPWIAQNLRDRGIEIARSAGEDPMNNPENQ